MQNTGARRAAVVLVGVLALFSGLGCAPQRKGQEAPDAQGQRARDSVIGASQLPGATGVRAALRVGDSASARRRVEDSVAQ